MLINVLLHQYNGATALFTLDIEEVELILSIYALLNPPILTET